MKTVPTTTIKRNRSKQVDVKGPGSSSSMSRKARKEISEN